MKQTVKIIAITVIIILALLLVLPIVFKGKIIDAVKKAANENINAKFEFADLHVSLIKHFPNVSVSLESLSIVGIEDFAGDTLVSVPDFSLSLNLMSVIKGDSYEIRAVNIDEARIFLKVLTDGKANWDIAIEDTTTVADTSETTSFNISLKKLTLNNSLIIYDDVSIPIYIKAQGVNHTLTGDFSESVTDLDTKTIINNLVVTYDGIRYLNKVRAEFDSRINANLKDYKFTFPDAHLFINDLELLAEGYFAMPEDSYEMDIKFNAVHNEFKHFLSLIPAIYTKDFEKVEATGSLGFEGYVRGIYNDNNMPAFGIDLNVSEGKIKYPDLPGTVENININAIVDNKTGDPDATIINISKFHLEMLGNPVDAIIYARTPVSDPYLDAKVIAQVNLDDISKVYPLDRGDQLSGLISADISIKGNQSDAENQRFNEFSAAGQVNLKNVILDSDTSDIEIKISEGQFILSPAFISMPVMDIVIGRNDLSAEGEISNYLAYAFDKGDLTGKLSLESNYLDLNVFMSEDSVVSDTSTSSLSVFQVPKNIDFTLLSSFNKIIYDKLEMTNVTGMLVIKDQVLSLSELKFNAMQGTMTLNGLYSTQEPERPSVTMNMSLKNIEVREAFENFNTVQKLAPIAKQTTGSISSNLSISTKLDAKMMPIPATLEGKGSLTSPGLAIKNVTAFNRIADVLKIDEFRQWTINKIDLSFELDSGKVFVKPFNTKIGKINTEISGWNSFDQTLEYALEMAVPRSTFGGSANDALEGLIDKANATGVNFSLGETVPITILITGTVTDPKISTSLKGTGANLKESIKKSIQEKTEEVVGKAKEEVGNYIEEANAKAQKILSEAQAQANQLISTAQQSAQKIRDEADKQANNLVTEGKKKGPIAEIAAKKAADKLRSEGNKKADSVIAEAQQKADAIMTSARQKAEQIKTDAQLKTR